MYKSSFGTRSQISFCRENDYYELLGYLSRNDGTTKITWERNNEQGAWAQEGRIHFYVAPPANLRAILSLTAGVGRILYRVNCNEFVENIIRDHQFKFGDIQNSISIRGTISSDYIDDFDRGVYL